MSTYTFETITAAQALNFNGALDTLVFTTPSQTGASERLIFNADGTITVLSSADGLRATFGPGLAGAGQIVYPDGSQMLVGSTGADVLTGGAHGDGLFGGLGADTLIGGDGDDALQGGPGADMLTGGAGRDLFIVVAGESPPVAGQMDTITDWQSSDALTFFRGPTLASSYMESTAADFASAKAFANTQIAAGTVEYVAMQVGGDVIVFADSHGDHGVAEDAVILAGRTLADIDASNILTSAIFPSVLPPASPPPPPISPPVSPPPPPVASQTLNGGPGPDILTGGPENDQFFGRGGADTLTGGGGADTFTIGQGESPTSVAARGFVENLVHITDFSSNDLLVFAGEPAGVGGAQGNLVGLSNVADFDAALYYANGLFNSRPGTVYVDAQVGNDLIVIDYQQQAVVLSNQSIQTFSVNNIGDGGPVVPSPPPPNPTGPPPLPPPPPPPSGPAHGVTAVIGGDPDISQLSNLLDNGVPTFSSTSLSLQAGGSMFTLTGFGFTLDRDENLTGGTLTGIDLNIAGGPHLHIAGLATPILTLADELNQDTNDEFFGAIFSGDDSIVGDAASVTIHGYSGRDTIQASGGNAFLFGDDGDDSLSGGAGTNHLVGGAGADTLAGGAGTNVFVFGIGDSVPSAPGGHLERLDHVTNWRTTDFLQFTGDSTATPTNYQEITAASYNQAADIALTNSSHRIDYTVAQVGSDVVVFAPSQGDAVVLSGRTLADISQVNVGGDPALAQPDPAPSPPPPPPPPPPVGGVGPFGVVQTGTAGDDHITATTAAGEVHAGLGNDTIAGAPTNDYLRGDEGDDSISGGPAFDDINGNMGDDTIHGNGGDDYSVGGKGNDLLFGDDGNDIVWGNLGNDTCDGGNGNDQVRGGQGDDSLSGGAGDDFISGDRGNDTESGGAGADIFHTFSGAGIDKVLDFNLAEGDRVQLDPGTTFTVTQVGSDTVIDMGNGDQMILVGVQASTLTGSWIFGA